jgi:hypothetical protein
VPDLLRGGSGNTFPSFPSFDEGGDVPGQPEDLQADSAVGLPGVNTIFQVIHSAGLRTAFAEKHAIYTSFNGPGSNGMSIDDFFGPEIDSQAVEPNGVPYPVDGAWTDDNAATKQYDSYKVQAVVNWVNGYGHSGTGPKVGTPAIYGMNFQAVSAAEKLTSSPAVLIGPNAQGKYTEGPLLRGGYVTVDGRQVPGPLLQSALGFVIAGVNAAWAKQHPGAKPLIVQEADDDGLLWWLSDRSQAAADFAPSTRPAQRSPSTAATTPATGTFRSSSTRPAPSRAATRVTTRKRPRSLRLS